MAIRKFTVDETRFFSLKIIEAESSLIVVCLTPFVTTNVLTLLSFLFWIMEEKVSRLSLVTTAIMTLEVGVFSVDIMCRRNGDESRTIFNSILILLHIF